MKVPSCSKVQSAFLRLILAAFLLLTIPFVKISVSVVEHAYAGYLYGSSGSKAFFGKKTFPPLPSPWMAEPPTATAGTSWY